MWRFVRNGSVCSHGFSQFSKENVLTKQLKRVLSVTLGRKMSESVVVKTHEGDLRGQMSSSISGKQFASFQGIPYAKPPVGTLRFMAPQPQESWVGIRDARAEGNVCPHKDMFFQNYVGDEDCLFLNVFTPKVPNSDQERKRAVMVWFHGGGFNTGNGNSDFYGPSFLVDQDVVLVTLNYRLGALGFLRLEEAGVSGNAGLKDQVAALQWVQRNISGFGGDPNNVTIFGESAGGACVQYHILSPMSAGLFHRAISQSGSALNWWAFAKASTAEDRAFRLGKLLGITTDDPRQLLDFLWKQPAEGLINNMGKTSTAENKARGDVFPFVPTIESGTVPGEQVFLSDTPLNLLKSGKMNHVPYITGVNSHEGILMLKDVLSNPAKWSAIDKEFSTKMIPLDMNVKMKTDQANYVANRIKTFYFGDRPVSYQTRESYVNLITDFWFGCGIDDSVKYHTQLSKAPTYYYEFSFDGDFGLFKKVMQVKDIPGACHADDLGYLFSNEMIDHEDADPNSPAMKTLRRLVKMWTDFAKTGNPTTGSDPLVTLNWEPASTSSMLFLDINSDLSVRSDRIAERMNFWRELYSETGTIHDSLSSKL